MTTLSPEGYYVLTETKFQVKDAVKSLVTTTKLIRDFSDLKSRVANIAQDTEEFKDMILSGGAKAMGIEVRPANEKDMADFSDQVPVFNAIDDYYGAEKRVQKIKQDAVGVILEHLEKDGDTAEGVASFIKAYGLRKDIVAKWVKDNKPKTSESLKRTFATFQYNGLNEKKQKETSIEALLANLNA